MRKFPSINYPESVNNLKRGDGKLIVQEKLDGANFRFTPTENGTIFGSRNVEFKEGDEPLPLEEVNKSFRHGVKYVNKHGELSKKYNDLTFYGECLHRHTVDYDIYEEDGKPDPEYKQPPNVVIFDIRKDGEWIEPEKVREICNEVNLPFVGIVDEIELPVRGKPDIDIPQSQFREPDENAENEFDRKGLAEGVVVKNTANGKRGKIVHESFKEKKSSSNSSNNTQHKFVDMYITEARIKKQAHKLVDEGKYDSLKMDMMEELPKEVIKDAMEEEGWSIICDRNNIIIDEKSKDKIRSQSSKKCAKVLKEMLSY